MTDWRKSTHSGGDNPNCVEAARIDVRTIGVRDSKNPEGGHLAIAPRVLREALASYLVSEDRGDS
ncbi:DUF397 domain-containing protein [Actinomadura harenae]|uniref:DUF397 domain-containing protein n=1 Tax=Actinomadura harenae TaxID=2483351 RepID=A0A3M2LVT2_9ACTN|nr:DUF397 domain-containing protein [Actinomadura harenae]RMI39048.1 DUF397 domain-containing protein [Actinomadura harenae]